MFRSLLCGKCCQSNVESVHFLDYSHSLLREVPSEIFLFERTLEKLYLNSNHLTELPRQLFHCDELRTLNLSDNEIKFLPPAISSLINLHKLDISRNGMKTLPDNIRSCSNLTKLNISVNPLDKLPDSLINLVSLTELYLNDVYLEFLPANFGKLVNLRILELRDNCLGNLPKTINRLVHLQRLDIGNNEFTELPEIVSSLHNLTELWIDLNHIRKLSASIGQLRKMIHFEASHNDIETLPRDIGYWTRIVEFSVSGNTISLLPTTIGNMKNLVVLKLDENNLKVLPPTIGKLTNLEELMLTHNYLVHLPSSIGLLRKLRILNVDKNYLQEIPPELGSCTSLSILSLRGNRLTEIPAEIGHLSNLKVLNLVDNQLKHLPMSILKLDKLSALWLATNQSQPLVPLQQDMNQSYQMVLTCFMLPQVLSKVQVPYVREREYMTRQAQRKRICFASDTTVPIEQPGRLTRAPTPYPKELRALAKHAKNIQRGLVVSNHEPTEEVVQPVQGPLQIKEAKVTVTPHNNINEPEPRIDEPDFQEPEQTTNESIEPKQISSEPCVLSQPVLAYENSPVIREAKNIRTDCQTTQQPLTYYNMKDDVFNTPQPQPPPYHIAAAYSVQAQFFNNDCLVTATGTASSSIADHNELTTNESYLNELNDNMPSPMADHENNIDTYSLSESNTDKPRTFIQDKPLPGQNVVIPTPKRLTGPERPPVTKIPHLATSPSMPKRNSPVLLPLNANSTSAIHYSPRSYRRTSVTTTPNNNINRSPRTKIPAPTSAKTSPDSSSSKWMFGQHKNATVSQVTLNKNPDLGFSLSENNGNGIYVQEIYRDDVLKIGDKILEIEGIDITKFSKNEALEILNSSGPSVSMMISHMN